MARGIGIIITTIIGIIMIVVGLTAGILSIVAGANALTLKKNILF